MKTAEHGSEIVVSGLAVVAPNGVDTESYWSATLAGKSAIAPVRRFDVSRFPVRLAGEIEDFDVRTTVPRRLVPQTDRMTRYAVAAADMSLEDASIDPADLPDYAAGVAVTGVTGGLEFGQRELQKLWGTGWETVSPYMSFAWYYAVHTGQISIRNGFRGPGGLVISEQASGLDTIAFARRRLRRDAAVMVTGGIDSMLCPYGMSTLATAPGVSRSTRPDRAYLPFRTETTGFVPGEGGAVLVLESRRDAERRGAPRRYGVIAGHGAVFDPGPAGPDGDGLVRAARRAMADAGVGEDDIDVVFADAFGERALDAAEADALVRVFGGRRVPVSAPKALVGRLLAGGAALDVATALLSIRDGVIPAVPDVPDTTPDARVDLVTGTPRAARIRTALVLSRGHGGFASALVVRAS